MDGDAAPGELTGAPEVTVGLARPEDEAGIRAVLRASQLPGPVRVAFTREPRFDAGARLAGAEDVTVVARREGRVVGLGQASVYELTRNGAARRVAYLGLLRLLPGVRGGVRWLRDGYAALFDALDGTGVDAVFTSIGRENARARQVLGHGRRLGLPGYHELASLVTFVAPVGHVGAGTRAIQPLDARRRVGPTHDGVDRDGADVTELTVFLQQRARKAHLALAWEPRQWAALGQHGIAAGDFCVVRRGPEIVGAAAVWDQRPFRQTVVVGYGPGLRVVRPIVNTLRAVRRLPRLPAPGSVLAQGAVLGAGVADLAVWPELWRELRARAAERGLSWLTFACDTRDPDLPTLRRLLGAHQYRTTLYAVEWGGHGPADGWDNLPVRPEVGLL
jgi:hypothetical protein